MLSHIGQTDIAARIQNAWLRTIEDGIHTYDIYREGISKQQVGTRAFAEAVIANLGKLPQQFQPASYAEAAPLQLPKYQRKQAAAKKLEGVDLFVHWSGTSADELAQLLQPLQTKEVGLSMITNRGIKVWPNGFEETFCTDHWRCRFKPTNGTPMQKEDIVELLRKATEQQIDTIKTENLYSFNGTAAFSLGQGQ